MTKEVAIKTVWEYMLLHHELKQADIIFVLGSYDVRVGEYAAQLWLDGWAPYLVCSGSGTIHNANPAWNEFIDSTEADVFANIAREAGVTEEVLLVENKSQNTGDNFKFTEALLAEKAIHFHKVIAVQKPFMERRVYATGKVHWPDVDLVITSPHIPLKEYPTESMQKHEHWIQAMVGDLQRIKEYPAKGFQIEQDIPHQVWEAYEYLVGLGYTDCLIK